MPGRSAGRNTAILSRLIKNMRDEEADPLRPLLDAYLIERNHAPERHVADTYDMAPYERPPGRFSPSDLGGCERAAAFRFLGVEARRRLDPDLELIFDDGNWRHLKWQAIFHDMEKVLGRSRFRVIHTEARVIFEDLYLDGSLDNVLYMKPVPDQPGNRWVLDIKGIRDAGFQQIVKRDEPIAKHVKQVVAYGRSIEVPRSLLWYENKDNQQTKAFVILDDEDTWREVEGWCTSVTSFMEQERVPPMDPDCNRGTIAYERCPYASHCYGSMSETRLTELAYDRFESVDALWEAGL